MSARHTLSLKERKTAWTIAAIFLLIIVLTFLEIFLQGVPLTSRFITNNIIVFLVVNVHIILLLILILLVLRNLIKLYFEHRQKILGSKFKTKLIVAFTALPIIPLLILFIGSLSLVNKSIHNWFDKRVEKVLQSTTEISKSYYQNLGQGNLHFARRLASGIATGRLLNPDSPERLIAFISTKQREYRLSSVRVYDAQLQDFVEAADPGFPTAVPSPSLRRHLETSLRGEEVSVIEPLGESEVLRSVVPVSHLRGGQELRAVLVVDTLLAANLVRDVKTITSTFEAYKQATILKNPIRVSYQAILTMITVLWIFMVTWFAFYLAKFITVPIQHLAEGTRRISEGDLDFRLDPGSDDELGMLIESFNRMTADLKTNKTRLDFARRRLERSNLELEGRKRYIETVLDSIATGVISVDGAGRVTTVNKAARAMLALEASPGIDLPIGEALAGETYRDIRAAIEELLTRSTDRLERKVDLDHEGGQINLLLVGSNLYSDRQQYAGSVIVLENLTEVINAQRIAAWREVARRIAHEIKNPLTPIKLSAQRLRKKFFQKSPDFDHVFDEGTEMIVHQVEELRKLVDEFSRFARMPSGKPVPLDLHALLSSLVKLYRETYREVEFRLSLHPEPLSVMADPEQLKRAFVNLIDNAVEAGDGHGTVEVQTVADPASGHVRVLVKDNGRGIPPELRDKLFVPYFSTKKQGTGLGLTIVSSIVSDHSGYIRIKSNHPRGTVFTVELPTLKGNAIQV